MTKIIAHRGYSAKFPENTLLAFQAAVDAGADGIELDVHMTRDGELVIIHDEQVDRTSDGSGYVKDLSLAELKDLDFSDETVGILTLREFLEWAGRYSDLLLNIELKTDKISYEGIEQTVSDLLDAVDIPNPIIISSFNYDSVLRMKALKPELTYGFLTVGGIDKPGEFCKDRGIAYYHVHYKHLTEDDLEDCNAAGVGVNVYTLNDPRDIQKFVDLGVDGVITDDVEVAIRLREGL